MARMARGTNAPFLNTVRDANHPHIVDQLIAERAPRLRENPTLWSITRRVGLPALGYRAAVRLADRVQPMDGRMAMNWMSASLALRVRALGRIALPPEGPALVVANHPGGIADGVAVWDALVDVRPDVVFFANRDAVRVAPKLRDVVIPVEWREQERTREKTRETLRAAADAFADGRVVVMFPAGRIARLDLAGARLSDRPWPGTPISYARKYAAPIIPVGISARMSALYYALAAVSDELKDMTLFHELLRAHKARYRLRFGDPVDPADLPDDPVGAASRLKRVCEALAAPF